MNAKQHAKEADVVAEAGKPGMVTIATNMAGRGTDIILGGSWEAEVAHLEAPTHSLAQDIQQLSDQNFPGGRPIEVA